MQSVNHLSLFSPLLPLLFLVGAAVSGRFCLRFFKLTFASRLEAFVFSAFFGISLWGHLVFLIGLAGWLDPKLLMGLLILNLLWAAAVIAKNAGTLLEPLKRTRISNVLPSPFWFLMFLFVTLGILSPLAASWAPPISTDELAHHLALPKIYLGERQISYRPYHVFSLLPSLMEMLYTLGLALGGPLLAKQFHLILGLLGALALGLLARRFIRPPWNWLAGVFFLLTPGINNQLPLAYNDVGLTSFSLMGFACLFLWLDEKKGAWLVLAGFFLGSALGMKHTAAFALLAALSLILFAVMDKTIPPSQAASAFVKLLIPAFLVGGFWYLRSYGVTGNPFFPYFHDFLGGKTEELLASFQSAHHGMGKGWLEFLLLPWNLTFHPESFGGRGNQLGPLFWVLTPGIFWVKRPLKVRYLLGMTLVIFVLWFFLKQNLRFLFPAVPLLCLLTAYGVGEAQNSSPWIRRTSQGLCLLLLGLQTGLLVFNKRGLYPVALGFESQEKFLTREVEGYEMAQYVNRLLPPQAKILTRELREFYFDRPVERHAGYYRRYAPLCRNEEDLYQLLKRDGFTHLLWKESGKESRDWLPLKMIQNEALKARGLKLVHEIDWIPPGSKRRMKYSLYQL